MCQVHTGAYVSLLAPGKTDYTACHPRKTTTYILHVVSITTHTHDRRKSTGKQEITNIEKMKEIKRRESGKRKGKQRKEKTKNARKTRQEEEARKGIEEKCHTRRP